jgi:hypothetical protein
VDPATGRVPDLLAWCVGTLANIVPDPSAVSLVITGDFVGSVRSRFPDDPSVEGFNLTRGTGMVAAKTMERSDGTIDVLMHAGYFAAGLDQEQQVAAAQIVPRTLVHEAAHVCTLQNKETYEHSGPPGRDGDLASLGYAILDEYRAELSVPLELREGELPLDFLLTLDTLAEALGQAVADYQQHHEVRVMLEQVVDAASVSCKPMACMAALERLDPQQTPLTDDVRADSCWQRMAGPQWPAFRRLLERAGPGDEVMGAAAIEALVGELATLLLVWLSDLGFDWTEDRFMISNWYFEDEYFLRALTKSS